MSNQAVNFLAFLLMGIAIVSISISNVMTNKKISYLENKQCIRHGDKVFIGMRCYKEKYCYPGKVCDYCDEGETQMRIYKPPVEGNFYYQIGEPK